MRNILPTLERYPLTWGITRDILRKTMYCCRSAGADGFLARFGAT
ncbi:hypothetical protein HMPREF9997_02110 [Corynebacterium durum F0235]|uniref:Uncharacterized protein n=1 Tax=Corynebacterium durum F0235 TaxID=1035195 RepID=L1MD37_9CORY|nr:hypothetical protein HMPREF9997_02110 [Corynebacterium durum F0235]